MSNQRLSTQDVAAILIEELSKIEQHTTRLTQIEATLRKDITASQQISSQHLQKFEALTQRKVKIDVSDLEQAIRRRQNLPRWAVWALILQPLILGLLTTLLVWLYVGRTERVAWNDGYHAAQQEQASGQSKEQHAQ